MSATFTPEEVPLEKEATGAIRVGGTRVLLELVIRAFQDRATPETIVQRYSSLALADVYAVVAYYLKHRAEVKEYLAMRADQSQKIQEAMESRQPALKEIRDRLLAERKT